MDGRQCSNLCGEKREERKGGFVLFFYIVVRLFKRALFFSFDSVMWMRGFCCYVCGIGLFGTRV